MSINEIEIPGTSLSLKVWTAKADAMPALLKQLGEEQFNVTADEPGFHDLDGNAEIVRGYYSAVIPFEVEHLVDGMTTKAMLKRIESAEFIMLPDLLITWGKPGPEKALTTFISAVTGYGVSKKEFEQEQMQRLEDALQQVRKIDLMNPKDAEIRRAKLSGQIEHYESCGVAADRHGIESIAGTADSPLGPLTLTVTRKGAIRFTVKRGFILTVDCIRWALSLLH